MKEIVMISPKFFNIEESIKNEFMSQGFSVIFFDERIDNSKLIKILIRKNRNLINRKIDRYFSEIYDYIRLNSGKIVMLFVVKAETMPSWFVKKIKENYHHIIAVHYMYDPISNYLELRKKLDDFDYCFTFDKKDSKEQSWIFRPLFYPDEFQLNESTVRDIDFSFIGTLHSDRSEVVDAIRTSISSIIGLNNISIFTYYYMPLYLMYFYSKILKGKHTKVRVSEVRTKPLSRESTAEKLKRTKHVIDVHHPSQTGLTARTFEALGSKSKIITTNPQIVNYNFYNKNNILVVDRDNPIITQEWLFTDYQEIDKEIYDFYSVKNFVNDFITILEET